MVDLHFEQTCFACPEQYDVYYGSRKVGYVRLRHGLFTVSDAFQTKTLYTQEFPVSYEEAMEDEEFDLLMLTSHVDADGLFGESDTRRAYLNIAERKIKEHMGVG